MENLFKLSIAAQCDKEIQKNISSEVIFQISNTV